METSCTNHTIWRELPRALVYKIICMAANMRDEAPYLFRFGARALDGRCFVNDVYQRPRNPAIWKELPDVLVQKVLYYVAEDVEEWDGDGAGFGGEVEVCGRTENVRGFICEVYQKWEAVHPIFTPTWPWEFVCFKFIGPTLNYMWFDHGFDAV